MYISGWFSGSWMVSVSFLLRPSRSTSSLSLWLGGVGHSAILFLIVSSRGQYAFSWMVSASFLFSPSCSTSSLSLWLGGWFTGMSGSFP